MHSPGVIASPGLFMREDDVQYATVHAAMCARSDMDAGHGARSYGPAECGTHAHDRLLRMRVRLSMDTCDTRISHSQRARVRLGPRSRGRAHDHTHHGLCDRNAS